MRKGSLVKLRTLPVEGGKSVLLDDCDEETQQQWKDPAVIVRGPYEFSFRQEYSDGTRMTKIYKAVDIMHKGVLYEAISIEHLDRIG